MSMRFAPSPTGQIHLGGLRTALFNYLYAKKMGLDLILRIEDTDQKRLIKGSKEGIIKSLKTFGINYTTMHVQSDRLDIYKEATNQLLEEGKAYRCFCTSERLDKMRKRQINVRSKVGYDNYCRKYSKQDSDAMQRDLPFTVRFKVEPQRIYLDDLVYKSIPFDMAMENDFIVLKQDKYPTYHLANVVDDLLMNVKYVMRGEEWIPSSGKHLLLHSYFSKVYQKEIPQFAHLPLLTNKNGKKLSKRDLFGHTLDDLLTKYKPLSILNFIADLGWEKQSQYLTLHEMAGKFEIKDLNRARAKVSILKLNHYEAINFKKSIITDKSVYIDKLRTVYNLGPNYSDKLSKIYDASVHRAENFKSILKDAETFFTFKPYQSITATDLKVIAQIQQHWKTSFDSNFPKSFPKNIKLLLRLYLSGAKYGVPLLQMMTILGQEECEKRLSFYAKSI